MDTIVDKRTPLMAFFAYNSEHPDSRQYLYQEFPMHFTWKPQAQKWKPRQRGGQIGRMYQANPLQGEVYYLRCLLTVVPGPTSFEYYFQSMVWFIVPSNRPAGLAAFCLLILIGICVLRRRKICGQVGISDECLSPLCYTEASQTPPTYGIHSETISATTCFEIFTDAAFVGVQRLTDPIWTTVCI
jgi:hypothetical protein